MNPHKSIFIITLTLLSNNSFSLDKYILKKEKTPIDYAENFIPELNLKNKIIKKAPRLIKEEVNRYIDSIFLLSKEYNLDPVFLTSLIWVESTFNNNARSPVGASGLMQIMPKTKKYLFKKINKEYYHRISFQLRLNKKLSFNDAENLILGSYYLSLLNKKFKNIIHSTTAYNMGPGWVNKKIRKKYPIGSKNNYLKKIKNKYRMFSLK